MLISPLYYSFFHKLLSKIKESTERYNFLDDRNNWIILIRQELETNTELEENFCSHKTNTALTFEERKKIPHSMSDDCQQNNR